MTLTAAGRKWATENAASSIVARIALAGSAQGWPASHVQTAIAACNKAA